MAIAAVSGSYVTKAFLEDLLGVLIPSVDAAKAPAAFGDSFLPSKDVGRCSKAPHGLYLMLLEAFTYLLASLCMILLPLATTPCTDNVLA